MKPVVSIDVLRISEQTKTAKPKSGGRARKKKKKKNVDAHFLSLIPSLFNEGSLEYRVHCRGGPEHFTKVRVLGGKEEVFARAFLNYINKMRKRDTEICFGASSYSHPN